MQTTAALTAATTTVRLVVVQPQALLRQGMVAMLEAAEGLQVAAHTGSIRREGGWSRTSGRTWSSPTSTLREPTTRAWCSSSSGRQISRILDRLDVGSRTELVVVALRDGLVA